MSWACLGRCWVPGLVLVAGAAAAQENLPPSAKISAQSLEPAAIRALPSLDREALRAEDAEREAANEPFRYAVARAVDDVKLGGLAAKRSRQWDRLPDGRLVWRLKVVTKDATSLDFGFSRYRMPPGGELYVYDTDKRQVRGPYTDADNKHHGQLWTPMVPGPSAVIEVVVPEAKLDRLELELTRINHGYRLLSGSRTKASELKSGACNVDVACPEADPWQDEVASVARYQVAAAVPPSLCTGQQINTVFGSRRPYFLTANHCFGNPEEEAPSITFYWNYESDSCRMRGTDDNADALPLSDDTQGGSTVRANFAPSDFMLLHLDEAPDEDFDVTWSGWDARFRVPDSAVSIHHPQGDAKRIAFDDDPQIVDDFTPGVPGDDTHLRVDAWNLGTTEPGSSGAGLWSAQRRLVGQLHGGEAACASAPPGTEPSEDNDQPDWFGRFAVSWVRGEEPRARLREWLDPELSGQRTADTAGSCDQPQVSIDASTGNPNEGQRVSYTVEVSGGTPPYDIGWDIDEDGRYEARGETATVRLTGKGTHRIGVDVVDSEGCGNYADVRQTVSAAEVAVVDVGEPSELAGDGDNRPEPGERWSVPVTFLNRGNAQARAAHAVFETVDRAGSSQSKRTGGKRTAGPDAFGYVATDSSEGNCAFDYVDISTSGTAIKWGTDNGLPNLPGVDDASGTVDLGGERFNLYGRNVDSLAVATNGYLSAADDNGADFSNDCPIPTLPDFGEGARIMPYHDDLVVNGDAFHQFFEECPRPAESGLSNGCHVFQWQDVDIILGDIFEPAGFSFGFEALLYPRASGPGDIVYQYEPQNPQEGESASVGVQDSLANRGLSYACEESGAVSNSSAVCISPLAITAEGLHLDTPALALGDIPARERRTAEIEITFDQTMSCDDRVRIDLHGVTHEQAFTAGPRDALVEMILGRPADGATGTAECDNQSVAAPALEPVLPQPGIWFNPRRSGNGADVYRQDDTLFFVWYTGRNDGTPIWYTATGEFEDNQLKTDLLRWQWDGSAASSTVVGEVIFTFTGEQRGIFNWTLNGVRGGEPFEPLIFSNDPPPSQHTGLWFNPDEPGWGLTFNDQGSVEAAVVYFFDDDGEPTWAIGNKNQPSADTINLGSFNVHCPGCTWAPLSAAGDEPAVLERTFQGPSEGTLSLDIPVPPPLKGRWQRDDITIRLLSRPLSSEGKQTGKTATGSGIRQGRNVMAQCAPPRTPASCRALP